MWRGGGLELVGSSGWGRRKELEAGKCQWQPSRSIRGVLGEKNVVKEGAEGGKVKKERHKSSLGMFLLRLLSMERAPGIKRRHV